MQMIELLEEVQVDFSYVLLYLMKYLMPNITKQLMSSPR